MHQAKGSEGRSAPCERCGAPLALAHGGRARCLFCLHDQPLPKGIETPLEEHAELAGQLGELRERVERVVRGRSAFLIIIGISAPLVLLAGLGVFASVRSAEGDALAQLMFASIGGLGLVPFIAIPILWTRVQSVARARQLAALPVSTPQVREARVVSLCPSCGAPHDPAPASLTTRCQSCQTEALLPLPLVSEQLAKKHHAVVEARAQGQAEENAQKAAVAAWQAMVKPALLGFGAFFFLVMVIFIALAEMRTPGG